MTCYILVPAVLWHSLTTSVLQTNREEQLIQQRTHVLRERTLLFPSSMCMDQLLGMFTFKESDYQQTSINYHGNIPFIFVLPFSVTCFYTLLSPLQIHFTVTSLQLVKPLVALLPHDSSLSMPHIPWLPLKAFNHSPATHTPTRHISWDCHHHDYHIMWNIGRRTLGEQAKPDRLARG